MFTKKDLLEVLKKLDIQKGDIVWVYTSLGMLGIPEGYHSMEDVCRFYFEGLKEAVGEEGTIIVPTYCYTLGRNLASEPAVYDPKTTPAEIGPFPEFFRRQEGVIRSKDPMIPVAAWGRRAKEIISDISPNSYGHGSVFEKLLNYENVKICNIGLGPNWIPYIHYLDWLHKVPFRYDKLFVGRIKEGTKERVISWIYPVRTQMDNSYPYGYRAGEEATKAGIWKYEKLGRGRIWVANYRRYFEFIDRKMENNKWYLAKGPEVDVEQKELERLNEKPLNVELGDFDPKSWLEKIVPLRRDLVSQGSEFLIKEISKKFQFEVKSWETGSYIGDWIVPERWYVRKAKLVNVQTGEVIVDFETNPAIVYGYSKPFKGEVERKTLLRHISVHSLIPNGRLITHFYSERDWGFNLTKEELLKLTSERFYVEIDTDFAKSRLLYAEKVIKGSTDREIVLVAFLGSVFSANLYLSGLFALLELLQFLENSGRSKYSFRFVVLPDLPALNMWLAENKNLQGIEGILFLTMLGKEFIYTFNRSNSFLTQHLEEGFKQLKKEFQILDKPPIDVPEYGGNPLVVDRSNPLTQKVVVFGRTLPVNSVFFPFYGFNTDLDKEIDWDIYKESVEDLKEIFANFVLTPA